MSYDGAPPQLRASDADREAAAERLRIAAGAGRLTPAEPEERLSAAYDARLCAELSRLTADVTPRALPPARPTFVPSSPRPANPLAIASIVAGVLWMSWFGSLLAIVFGHIALRQIARAGGRQSGRGLAAASL